MPSSTFDAQPRLAPQFKTHYHQPCTPVAGADTSGAWAYATKTIRVGRFMESLFLPVYPMHCSQCGALYSSWHPTGYEAAPLPDHWHQIAASPYLSEYWRPATPTATEPSGSRPFPSSILRRVEAKQVLILQTLGQVQDLNTKVETMLKRAGDLLASLDPTPLPSADSSPPAPTSSTTSPTPGQVKLQELERTATEALRRLRASNARVTEWWTQTPRV